jgi:hypothetical protein
MRKYEEQEVVFELYRKERGNCKKIAIDTVTY